MMNFYVGIFHRIIIISTQEDTKQSENFFFIQKKTVDPKTFYSFR